MERNLRRISDELKLPQESRERIRSQLASYQKQSEVIPVKKMVSKKRILMIAAAVVMVMALGLTATAAVAHLFRNDIIVSSMDDVPKPSNTPVGVIIGVSDSPAPPLSDELIEAYRSTSADWPYGNEIDGNIVWEYSKWDFVEVLSSDPALRSRRIGREDGAEKMEYTAENPANLVGTLTGRVTFDLSWMNSKYDYVPDANRYYVVKAPDGSYVSEDFNALYAKPDDSGGYLGVEICNLAQADFWPQNYIIDGIFDTAYYYTSADGYEFLIKMVNGFVRVDCQTSHACIKLYGAYFTAEEVEDILDHLSLTINE